MRKIWTQVFTYQRMRQGTAGGNKPWDSPPFCLCTEGFFLTTDKTTSPFKLQQKLLMREIKNPYVNEKFTDGFSIDLKQTN